MLLDYVQSVFPILMAAYHSGYYYFNSFALRDYLEALIEINY